ncbi:MAG: hypothetical protein IIA66_07870 [Planctomycetes bacterium]|nr:hypothetical protein [Planctomycetota bacterium]
MKRTHVMAAAVCAALACIAVVLSGCHNSKATPEPLTVEKSAVGAVATVGEALPIKGGAQAWAQNCMRCHNLRQPHERSDREWEAIVFHMRVRANLTAEEHRLIVEFLKAAN